ncbi:PAS domain S-box protein [Solirubrobacter sp. CPCC 204708]|uniref:histidine kinase n=1 Tax=Solirubrobacter deserti TaxID=2282478 RepID=A0ABT4RT74_9ACTN|nr:PAS domain S-box protein [Solirubrobacter deserti]MBE2314358.1 PAS domain S-box protein [Solirubrobacter deserti]MDA0141456.1 PAS domain S-box protein [Solirubrobacter deserti]
MAEPALTTMLAAVAASVPDAVVVSGLDGCVRYVNPAAERLFGSAAAELAGRHVSELSSPPERERSRELATRLAAGERVPEPAVMELLRRDGSVFSAEVTLSPLMDDDGVVTGIVAVGRDVSDRVRAEAQAARLRAIVDAAAEAILGVDVDGTILFFSPSAERLFGWPAEEIVGRSGDELVVPEHRLGAEALFAAVAAKGILRRGTVAQRRDGTRFEVEVSTAPIRDPSGTITGAAMTVLDVSDRLRAQRLLDRIIEHAPNSIALKDLEGRYLLTNRGGGDRTPEEMIGRLDSEMFPADVAALSRAQEREVLAAGVPMTFSLDFTGPSGRDYAFVVTRFPLPGPDGQPEAIGVIASDVSELRRAEADQAQLAALVQAAPDAIVARDEEGRIATWNPGAEAMFGLRAEEAIGRSYAELVVPEDERALFESQLAEVHRGRTLTVRSSRLRHDGSHFPAQVSMAPLTLLDGHWRGSLALIRDITDLDAAERTLEERAAQLERSNAELERFAYAASHDLQEPLQSIQLSAGALIATTGERLEPDERELMTHIDAAASRLSGQIRSLMQVARVALGGAPAERVPVAVAVRDAVDALRAAAAEASAEVVVHEPLPEVLVPRTEVALVLQNVIANAIKYRRPDVVPRVEVVATVTAEDVEIRVADNGVGLTAEDLERVFGLFERGPTAAEGTGMGLAVARRMLERLGGRLEAASPGPGRGSVFSLRVPAAR